jgi:hypothetical protein
LKRQSGLQSLIVRPHSSRLVAEDPDEEERMRQLVHALEEAVAPLPNEESKTWFRLHPEYIFDEEERAKANHFFHVAQRETGEVYTPKFFASFETHLGMRKPPPQRQAFEPRQAASPPRGPAVNYSAPPSRESPSMSTGRAPASLKLTPEELDLARTLKLSPDEYRRGKERMLREKGEGHHGDGR